MKGFLVFVLLLAAGAAAQRRWVGEKTLSAWVVGSVAVAMEATEVAPKRNFTVVFSSNGTLALWGGFAVADELDVRFHQDLREGVWTVLKQEEECRTVSQTGQFATFTIRGARRPLDPERYCASRLAPSHAELKLEECEVRLRVSYAGMWHAVELQRDPPCPEGEL